MRRDYRLLIASAAVLAFPLSVVAAPGSLSGTNATMGVESTQQAADTYQLTGKVVDENGVALPGVNIIIQGTKRGVSTDVDGKFTIEVKKTDVLRMTFIGYKDEYVPVKGRTSVKVDMTPDAHTLQDVQVVAFGTQKKESVVSSITTIRPGDLRTSSSDLTTSFAGRIPGMIAWQTGGLPGALTENEMNTKFYVRGITSFQSNANTDPLILIDGVESSKLDLSRLTVEDIETFNVMKDASATAMYGARGANGVILVTTKKGEAGTVYTSARYEAIVSMPTQDIDLVDPVNYMKYYNEALLTRNPTATPQYSQERIALTGDKRFPSWAYPANDWYKTLFKNYSMNHHVNVNIRGGSKIMQYYVSLNYNHDSGMLKTDRLNQFDINIKNNTLSFRTNLTIDLKPGIQLLLSSATNWDKYHGPLQSASEAYKLAVNASPVDFAPTYPADDTYAWPHTRFGVPSGGQLSYNPYASLQQGYLDRDRYSTTNRVEYIHNLSKLIKGLELRANVSLVKTGYYSTPYAMVPALYSLKSYDQQTGKFALNAENPDKQSPSLDMDEDSKQSLSTTQLTYELRAYHTAAWGDHQTSLTFVANAEQKTSTQGSSVLETMEHRNMGISMRGTYGFKDRYFVEGSFGYNGSERFSKKNKYGFFPAIGGAYVLSNEKFWKPLQKIAPFFKLRATWGKVGNDGIISSPRFVYLPVIVKNGRINPRPGSDLTTGGYTIQSYGNENIKWEIAEQTNLGLEAKFLQGLIDIQVDAYKEIRHNILDYRRVIPASMGLEYYQLDNVGSAKSHGIDFSGKIQKAFTPDFFVILNTTLTYSRAKYLSLEEATDKPEWQKKVGHDISQQVGYIAEGLFTDQAEIDNSPKQSGDVQPGDIRYRDVNGDGVISIEDAVHIGYPTTPELIYGFNGFIQYKGWEFNFAFQGSGRRTFFIDPASISPFYGNRAMLKAIADDHWSTDNMNPHAFWPRLSINNIVYHNNEENRSANTSQTVYSTYFMRDCRFLRCTALELAYNMPHKVLNRIGIKNVRIYVRATNPFVITDFHLWDVELGENGFNYPIQKSYSMGLNFSF
jgi:TonB-linked SusC/RagA family outer membrane protein